MAEFGVGAPTSSGWLHGGFCLTACTRRDLQHIQVADMDGFTALSVGEMSVLQVLMRVRQSTSVRSMAFSIDQSTLNPRDPNSPM